MPEELFFLCFVAERKVAIQRQQLELKKKQEAQKRALTEVSLLFCTSKASKEAQKRALTEVSLLAVLVEKDKYYRAQGEEARDPDAPVFCTSKASKVSTCAK
jgi:hypothetical protein